MSLRVFITGGSGFIGRHLRENLEKNYEIYAPTSKELDLLNTDKVSSYLKDKKFDVVIHAATWNATRVSTKDTSKVLYNNLRMFFNLARGNKLYDKMIYFGSGAEYGRYQLPSQVKEDFFDTVVPEDDYGFSKYIMAKHALKSDNIYDLVLFGVYGKYEDWRIRFVSNACYRVAKNLPINIRRNVFFDYMYIDDLIKIIKWFVENRCEEKRVNVCTGKRIDLLSLAEIVLQVSGKELDISIANGDLGNEYSGNTSRLRGLVKQIEWTEHRAAIQSIFKHICSRVSG